MDLDALKEALDWMDSDERVTEEEAHRRVGLVRAAARAVLDAEEFEIECAVCEGMAEVLGCRADSPDICVSCDHGDLNHVIACPECDGSGVWSVIRDPVRVRLLAEERLPVKRHDPMSDPAYDPDHVTPGGSP